MFCKNPIRLHPRNKLGYYIPEFQPDGLLLPCGKCLQCRIQKKTQWAARMLHELDSWPCSIFITLTYRDTDMPANASLVKRDLQLFFKRLRKSIEPRKIKYFACGEYGFRTYRPHYHAIIYGLDYTNILDHKLIMDAWPYADWLVDGIYNGSFGSVTSDSVQYVAKYIDKQYNGELEYTEYVMTGRETPFKLSSNGLGLDYAIKNKDQIIENLYVTVNGAKISIPRYYCKKLNIDSSRLKEIAKTLDMEYIASQIGIEDLSSDDVYKIFDCESVLQIEQDKMCKRNQRDKNLHAKLAIKEAKQKVGL